MLHPPLRRRAPQGLLCDVPAPRRHHCPRRCVLLGAPPPRGQPSGPEQPPARRSVAEPCARKRARARWRGRGGGAEGLAREGEGLEAGARGGAGSQRAAGQGVRREGACGDGHFGSSSPPVPSSPLSPLSRARPFPSWLAQPPPCPLPPPRPAPAARPLPAHAASQMSHLAPSPTPSFCIPSPQACRGATATCAWGCSCSTSTT